jgi:hypothetical protein
MAAVQVSCCSEAATRRRRLCARRARPRSSEWRLRAGAGASCPLRCFSAAAAPPARPHCRTLFWGMTVPSPENPAISAMMAMARGSDDSSRSSRRHAATSGPPPPPPLVTSAAPLVLATAPESTRSGSGCGAGTDETSGACVAVRPRRSPGLPPDGGGARVRRRRGRGAAVYGSAASAARPLPGRHAAPTACFRRRTRCLNAPGCSPSRRSLPWESWPRQGDTSSALGQRPTQLHG